VAAAARTVQIIAKPVVLVDTCFVVTRMTACTSGLIAGRRPVDYFCVGSMAIRALEVATVIKRFVR